MGMAAVHPPTCHSNFTFFNPERLNLFIFIGNISIFVISTSSAKLLCRVLIDFRHHKLIYDPLQAMNMQFKRFLWRICRKRVVLFYYSSQRLSRSTCFVPSDELFFQSYLDVKLLIHQRGRQAAPVGIGTPRKRRDKRAGEARLSERPWEQGQGNSLSRR